MNTGTLRLKRMAARMIAVLLLVGCASDAKQSAGKDARGGGQVVVHFVNAERFSDVELTDQTREASRAAVLPALERTLQRVAARELPAGYTLDLRVTDIDMAGWMRPTRDGRRLREVREGLPAIIKFEYTLRDVTGQTVQDGRKTLSRMPSQSVAVANVDPQTTTLLNEMMETWLRSLGRGLQPGAK